MSIQQSVVWDERTAAVENAGFKWAYCFLFFGLVLDSLYRGEVRKESIWDLLALSGVSAAIMTVYLIRHKAVVPLTSWRQLAIVYGVAILMAVLAMILPAIFSP